MPRSNRHSIFGPLPRLFASPKHAERAQTPPTPPNATPSQQYQHKSHADLPALNPLSLYSDIPLPKFIEHMSLEVAIEAALQLHAKTSVSLATAPEGSRAAALEEYQASNVKLAQLGRYLASRGHFVEREGLGKRLRSAALAYHVLSDHRDLTRTRPPSIAASDSSFYTDPE